MHNFKKISTPIPWKVIGISEVGLLEFSRGIWVQTEKPSRGDMYFLEQHNLSKIGISSQE